MMSTNCWMGYGHMFGGPLGMVIGILFWLVVIFGMFYLVRFLFISGADKMYRKESPLNILKRKYANGEIDIEEFEERKSTMNF